MPIEVGQTFAKSISLPNIGDFVVGALCFTKVVPMVDFETKQPLIGEDGRPRTQDVLTLLVTAGNASIGQDGEKVAPGDTVTVYVKGHRRWAFGKAKDARGMRGKMHIGDVITIRYDRNEKSSKRGAQDKKVWTFEIKPNQDPRLVAEAEAIYGEESARGGVRRIEAPDTGPHDDGDDGDSIPF